MKKEARIHLNRHAPLHRPSAVLGFTLEEGDELRETDVYDSTSGNWESCPCPGNKVGAGMVTVWVRPEQ